MANAPVPAIDDINTLPQPSHITLLLRHHKSVTLLSVSPTQTFDSIKELLLSALEARGISKTPALPASSANDIEFGILVDKKDISKGWKLLTPETVSAASTTPKKRSNVSTGNSKANPGGNANTPDGAGLVDGSWLAYRVRKVDSTIEPQVDANGDVAIEMDPDQGWDVILPSFDDDDDEEVDDERDHDDGQAGPS